MRRFRYDEASSSATPGGNLHFCFAGSTPKIERYRQFMHEVTDMVVNAYDGSLKAERHRPQHRALVELGGAGRYAVMQRIRRSSTENLLNPGVIIANPGPISKLNPLPRANRC
jgi:D-lactate dehydrogenase